jgi:anthranilate/para-aminobenzoate synthase component I
MDYWVEPETVFMALFASAPLAFWLDSGRSASGGTSYLGSALRQITASTPAELLAVLGPELAAGAEGVVDAGLPGFTLGWVGWLGYEFGARAQGVTGSPAARTPDSAFLFAERALAFDHAARVITLMALTNADDETAARDWLAETGRHLRGLADQDQAPDPAEEKVSPAAAAPEAHWRHDEAQYAELIDRCQAAIHRGDAYQICLTNEIRVHSHPDPVSTYLRLRAASPSHHGGFLRFGEISLLSSSPEQFLSISPDRRIITKPIKGTRPRGGTLARDLELRAELESSEKERAENLMIVDLMRNDLTQIAELGTVEVTSLLVVESYSNVHQLVSTIEATMRGDLGPLDVILASFPAGSMTGAPKISAIGILSALEQGPRGIYAGAFGYLGLDGAVDLAMVIRSIVITPEGASIGTGGGITALSTAAEEIAETQVKAAPLLAALGIGERLTGAL